jgi:hypothetical protein
MVFHQWPRKTSILHRNQEEILKEGHFQEKYSLEAVRGF